MDSSLHGTQPAMTPTTDGETTEGKTMAAVAPEEFDDVFKAAYESGDPARVAELYEEDAVLVQPGLDHVVVGRPAIERAVADTFGFLSEIVLTLHAPTRFEVAGEHAWCHGSSTTEFTLPDGTRHSADSRSTTVLHRGVDGLWRLALDHAS